MRRFQSAQDWASFTHSGLQRGHQTALFCMWLCREVVGDSHKPSSMQNVCSESAVALAACSSTTSPQRWFCVKHENFGWIVFVVKNCRFTWHKKSFGRTKVGDNVKTSLEEWVVCLIHTLSQQPPRRPFLHQSFHWLCSTNRRSGWRATCQNTLGTHSFLFRPPKLEPRSASYPSQLKHQHQTIQMNSPVKIPPRCLSVPRCSWKGPTTWCGVSRKKPTDHAQQKNQTYLCFSSQPCLKLGEQTNGPGLTLGKRRARNLGGCRNKKQRAL